MQKNTKSIKNLTKPLIFKGDRIENSQSAMDIVAQFNPTILDEFDAQIEDLIKCRFPQEIMSGKPIEVCKNEWLSNNQPDEIATWVYFPWKNTMVKLLSEALFIECRTNRNQLKITPEEQNLLHSKTILFVGLSVGQAAAVVAAQQRIAGQFILADYDTLSLSNLNRLRASVLDLGKTKTEIAAQTIWEIDPYLQITIIENGITEDNFNTILLEQNIDLIVEECDNLPIKLLIRELAKENGIPVIMETNDKGLLDIERYDLDKAYPILHGLFGEINYSQIKNIDPKSRIELLKVLVNFENISQELKKSYQYLGIKLISWPQLASEVAVGGGVLVAVGSKILLNKPLESGRYYFDLDNTLNNQCQQI